MHKDKISYNSQKERFNNNTQRDSYKNYKNNRHQEKSEPFNNAMASKLKNFYKN